MLDEGKTVAVRDSIRKALQDMGYVNGYVTVDNYDWYMNKLFQDAVKAGKQVHYDRLRQAYVTILFDVITFYDRLAVMVLGRSPKHVLLLHENDLAALFIDDLVMHIRDNGWTIIPPGEAYADPIADHVPDVLFNNQGRVAAIAAEQGYESPLRHISEDVKYLDHYFETGNIFE